MIQELQMCVKLVIILNKKFTIKRGTDRCEFSERCEILFPIIVLSFGGLFLPLFIWTKCTVQMLVVQILLVPLRPHQGRRRARRHHPRHRPPQRHHPPPAQRPSCRASTAAPSTRCIPSTCTPSPVKMATTARAPSARGDALRRGPGCGHGFHACCAERWLRVSATCPMCRDSPVAKSIPWPSGSWEISLCRHCDGVRLEGRGATRNVGF
ncbi:hypothetical protein SETIT_2G021400v2 [Setaria italica]|uniref:RING-type domain-containing protein n=1 Tax=Setaria italica TaxID=4555 RepID=A0A368PWK5_SETIT|nr:hypothetical protein SETIT_2G021400v2 [Setaria italica]